MSCSSSIHFSPRSFRVNSKSFSKLPINSLSNQTYPSNMSTDKMTAIQHSSHSSQPKTLNWHYFGPPTNSTESGSKCIGARWVNWSCLERVRVIWHVSHPKQISRKPHQSKINRFSAGKKETMSLKKINRRTIKPRADGWHNKKHESALRCRRWIQSVRIRIRSLVRRFRFRRILIASLLGVFRGA